jgi:hypothetical protein
VLVRTDNHNVEHVYADRGVTTLEGYGSCTAYVVDGQLIGNGNAVYTIDASGAVTAPEDETAIPAPSNLIAIEVYQPGEPSPVADGGVDRCLKVLLWTKSVLGKGQ